MKKRRPDPDAIRARIMAHKTKPAKSEGYSTQGLKRWAADETKRDARALKSFAELRRQ